MTTFGTPVVRQTICIILQKELTLLYSFDMTTNEYGIKTNLNSHDEVNSLPHRCGTEFFTNEFFFHFEKKNYSLMEFKVLMWFTISLTF